jgi:hypothetical protein
MCAFIQVGITRSGPKKSFMPLICLMDQRKTRLFGLKLFPTLLILFFYCHRLHLEDVLVGKVTFINTKLKVDMEIHLIKKESTFQDKNAWNENETLIEFETMDGAPVKGFSVGEVIPIRLFFHPLNLTPSYQPTYGCCFSS